MIEKINSKKFYAVGIMSGTSMDGVDASLILTDGYEFCEVIQNVYSEYTDSTRASIIKIQENFQGNVESNEDIDFLSRSLGIFNIETIKPIFDFAEKNGIEIDVVGYHGQTVYHSPANKVSIQIGDPQSLANFFHTRVVFEFRSLDILNGGQGAPLTPIYHKAKFNKQLEYPYAILNIGGISNLTYINHEEMIAFDIGPGNAIIDDLVRFLFKKQFDVEGEIASSGIINFQLVDEFMEDDYFKVGPPKSLDRNYFNKYTELLSGDPADKIATASFFTVRSIIMSLEHFSEKPKNIVICGGGSKNNFLIKQIAKYSKSNILLAEDLNFNSNFIEAEAFGFLAVRRLLNEPISYPNTTGVKEPLCGGKVYEPSKSI